MACFFFSDLFLDRRGVPGTLLVEENKKELGPGHTFGFPPDPAHPPWRRSSREGADLGAGKFLGRKPLPETAPSSKQSE